MVALPHGSMEREGNFWFRAGFSHRIRRQQVRLGCQVWRFLHRRLLVSAEASPSHQLSGAPSGLFRSEMLDQGQSSVVCPAKDGQCIGGSVHQPSRGHPFQGTVGPGIGSAAILPGPSHLTSGGISPRTGEYGSGLAIASLQRFQSLEASSGRFFCSTRLLGSFFSGSFCLEAGSPDSSIFQLASGSVGSCQRCVPTGLDAGAALCVSTVRNDYSGLGPSQETKSELGAHHANLEVASVVSSSTGTFLGFSNPTPPLSRTTSQSRSPSSPNGTQRGATPDGVEDYRGRWSLPGLSEYAEDLLSKAWAGSTIKRYRSAWRRWYCWCVRRGCDPMGAELTQILNFLASLSQQGLAYRSVNTFRSAISAGHVRVQGKPVGEHPFVCRLLRGLRLSLPPEHRYSELWNVNRVLNLFLSWQ